MTDTRDELIAALESAEEPSRELDLKIAVLVNYGGSFEGENWRWNVESELQCDGPAYLDARFLPRLTASIDAALTLVPDGSEWQVTNIYGRNQAEVDLNSGHGSYSSGFKNHPATPAIAICIAALKAEQS